MARTTRITKIDRRGARNTIIRIRGGGYKNEIHIDGGMQELRQWIRSTLDESNEVLVALALAWWLKNNPNEASDFSAIEGKQITLDLTQPVTAGVFTIQ